MINYYIFTKGKDGFLYPNINKTQIFGDFQTLEQNLATILATIKANYILSDAEIKTEADFDEKYVILFDLKPNT